MSRRRFDLVVLGVGMAGLSAAQKCAKAGWSVAVVDCRPYGGTCALRGCDPKKILRRGPEILDAAHRLAGRGFDLGTGTIRWSDLVAQKRSFTDEMPGRIEDSLERTGVTRLHGPAAFVGPRTLRVDATELSARRVLIATGARPRVLTFSGAELVTDSTEFMELDQLPRHIVFLGGGYVSMEFAHMACRAGARATVLDRGERILKAFDPDLTERLTARSRAAGIEFRFEAEVKGLARLQSGYRLETTGGAIDCDLIVHGAGRVADIDGLNLEAGEVEATARGVQVNDYLQSTSNPNVYAAGDAADTAGAPLTPVAVAEGNAAAANLLRGNQRTVDHRATPSVAFTIPEIARLGMSESEARGRGVRVVFRDTANWYSQLRVGETHAATKVLIDEKTDRLVGAHLLGHGYAEAANVIALAMQQKVTAAELRRSRFVYPSASSDIASML